MSVHHAAGPLPRAAEAGPASSDRPALEPHPTLVRMGRFFFRRRRFIFPLLSLALLAGLRPVPSFGTAGLDDLVDAAGIAAVLAGQTLRVVVIGFAYIVRGGRGGEAFAEGLVQEGVFAHSRNPLYVGNWLVLLGFFLIHGSPAALIAGMLFFTLAYGTIVLAEESYLLRRFGPVYEDYCRRVRRFTPSLRGLRASLGGMRFDGRRVIRKEYGTLFSNCSTLLALLLWERRFRPGGLDRSTLLGGISVWAVAVALYLTARHLKKARRLGRG